MTKSISVSEALFTIILALIIRLCMEGQVVLAQCGDLPEEEKNAFHEIANRLGKTDWDSKLNPCNLSSLNFRQTEVYNTTIKCTCSYPDGLYHIESIILTGQDLAGVLPPSLAKLPYLKQIHLSRNYLHGTIPPEWASIKLEDLIVSENLLSGPIPRYLGNITTLVNLSLENNLFNGSVPAELGKLVNLEKLILSSNFLTGELPMELNKLKSLTELRLSSNNFTGKLPSTLGWTSLQQLEIQASGFEGPIPSSISVLANLTELKISDLNGGASEFPPLEGLIGMSKLMLRSCNISGIIPPYLANLSNLRILYCQF